MYQTRELFFGMTDFISYIDKHPTDINACMRAFKVLYINVQTMKMFGARSKEGLPANLNRIFRGEIQIRFQNELAALWNRDLEWSGWYCGQPSQNPI